jgi:hypothetical protein
MVLRVQGHRNEAAVRRHPFVPVARLFLTLALVGLVASCAKPKYLETVKLTPICPKVGVLGDAERLTEFVAGPTQDLTDVALEARLGTVSGSCAFDEEEQKITLSLDIPLSTIRGPAYRGPVRLSYFVATLDAAKNVMGRKQFDVSFEIPSDTQRFDATEQLSETYNLKPDTLGAAYQVLVGFVLSPQQLAYNRSHR